MGVGNCVSPLVQGVGFQRHARGEESVPGLMHVKRGGYSIRDLVITVPGPTKDREPQVGAGATEGLWANRFWGRGARPGSFGKSKAFFGATSQTTRR